MSELIPYDLIAKYYTGECSEKEMVKLQAWRKENAANEKIFAEYAGIWENAGGNLRDFQPDIKIALEKVNEKIGAAGKQPGPFVKKLPAIYYFTRIAAVLAIVFSVWFGYSRIVPRETEYAEIISGEAKREVTLPDGSVVSLNMDSRIKYPLKFGRKSRTVELEGEAYFEVAHDARRPFLISAQQSVTKVLGTAFNLRAYPQEDKVVITVTEGKVAFATDDAMDMQTTELTKGEKAVLMKKERIITAGKIRSQNFMAWKTGHLSFDFTPLNEVVTDLAGFYKTGFYIAGEGLDTLRLKLDIPAETPPDDAMDALIYITGIGISKTDSGYIFCKEKLK